MNHLYDKSDSLVISFHYESIGKYILALCSVNQMPDADISH